MRYLYQCSSRPQNTSGENDWEKPNAIVFFFFGMKEAYVFPFILFKEKPFNFLFFQASTFIAL